MTTATAPPPPAPAPAPPRYRTAADWHRSLGNVPLHRIVFDPPPGTATLQDVVRLADGDAKQLVELVNDTLVEKPVGLRESIIATRVSRHLGNVVDPGKLGYVSGEAGMIRMLAGNVRMPDVAFFRREDLPDGQLPPGAAPRVAPALAVEVLSESNTDEEMRIKVREYFDSGVRAVWILDPATETLRTYDAPDRFRQLARGDTVNGGDVVPGFAVAVATLFEV